LYRIEAQRGRGIVHAEVRDPAPGGIGPEVRSVIDPLVECYDERTTVLTRAGWKECGALTNYDEFLTRSPDGLLEYQVSTAIRRYGYRGKMLRICSRSTDLLVTPKKKMLVQTHADFLNGRSARLIRAAELTQRLYRIPCGGVYYPETKGLCRAKMYLVGLYVSEGFIQEYDGKRPEIRICQNRGPKWDRIFDWLGPLDPRSRGARRIAVTMPTEFIWWLSANCGRSTYNKRLSSEILCNEHLDALFEGMVLGDGYRGRRSNTGTIGEIHYYTVSRELAGDFQELCLKLGYSSTAHRRSRESREPPMLRGGPVIATRPSYDVVVRTSETQKILPQRHITVERYDGEAFGVTVPNHTLFVRRNGRTAWCGDSEMM
jgi:hypothetical protein